MKKVLFPGSFDPITYGHMDIVKQALKIYDKILMCPLINYKKNSGMFTIEERRQMIKEIYVNEPRVEIITINEKKAAVDIALDNGCNMIIKGLRNVTDFAYEVEQAKLNLEISNVEVNTIALFANPTKTIISSSTVKELFSINKDISPYVPEIVRQAIINKCKEV